MAIYFYHLPVQNLVKIGTSQDVDQRLKTLTTGCTEHGVLLRVIEGFSFKAEKWLHAHFKDLRVKGEWFAFSPEMLEIAVPKNYCDIYTEYACFARAGSYTFPNGSILPRDPDSTVEEFIDAVVTHHRRIGVPID